MVKLLSLSDRKVGSPVTIPHHRQNNLGSSAHFERADLIRGVRNCFEEYSVVLEDRKLEISIIRVDVAFCGCEGLLKVCRLYRE